MTRNTTEIRNEKVRIKKGLENTNFPALHVHRNNSTPKLSFESFLAETFIASYLTHGLSVLSRIKSRQQLMGMSVAFTNNIAKNLSTSS